MSKRFFAALALVCTMLLVSSCADKEYDLCVTLTVNCENAVNSGVLSEELSEILPADGVIFPETEVGFTDGESVFDILSCEMKNAGIHMESSFTPLYGSAYIEGIANLYEFDCGELSGWMYCVNGVFPEYGCSSYYPEDGDTVEWVYTCDLGKDVGADTESE